MKQEVDKLDNLTNIEFASKMILGALSQQTEMNPLDYIYHALNLLIEPLEHEGAEFALLQEYIHNTWESRANAG